METLEMRVERLEKQLAQMQPKREQWVGPTVITSITGWDHEEMRKARRNGSVTYRKRKNGKGYEYLPSTVIIKETA
jgi:hypothetical protein